ncbi:hypothetical protein JB92DRAFT_2863353 [Gautieria morchelliformis]|nr:hypothetical protein JB92DRAFT_2863353 [Gautieria morchelliformis]
MDVITLLVDRESYSHPDASYMARGILAANDTSPETPTQTAQNMRMRTAWIGLQLAGQVTLPILIATLLFHKRIARRNPTVINLCIVWTLATIPPELLFYTGRYNETPSTMLCLFQASMISAMPPMAATAYLAVVVHAGTVLHEIIHSHIPRPFALDLRMIVLLSSPYISFFTFSLYIAVVGARNPDDVVRGLFVCEVLNHNLSFPVFSFTVVVAALTLIAQFWVSVMFYRNYLARRRRRTYGSRTSKRPLRELSSVDIQLLIRMVAYTIFEIVVMVASISAIFNPELNAGTLLLATPPIAVFLIFSTSRDIFQAWFPCFFRNRSGPALDSHTTYDDKMPHDVSGISRYSQQSLLPPPLAKTKVSWVDREASADLEKGVAAESRVNQSPDQYQTQSTMTVVGGSRSSGPESPLDAIRALRAPGGQRIKLW